MRKIIGIGETVLDILFKNEQPIRAIPGGSTYNSIISIGRLGIPAVFISETGDDRVGKQIRDFLQKNNVSTENICLHSAKKSALSLAFLNEHNDAEYLFYKDHAHDRLDFKYPEIHPNDIVLFGSYYAINEVVRQQVKNFLQFAYDQGAILYYDVNFRSAHKKDAQRLMANIRENFALAQVVRGSNEDFQVLFESSNTDHIYKNEIEPYCTNFIDTYGPNPAQLRAQGGLKRSYPVPPIQTISSIGAGDSFNAGFAYGLIREHVSRSDLQNGLPSKTWDKLFAYAQDFSKNVCLSVDNYIDENFANAYALPICTNKS